MSWFTTPTDLEARVSAAVTVAGLTRQLIYSRRRPSITTLGLQATARPKWGSRKPLSPQAISGAL